MPIKKEKKKPKLKQNKKNQTRKPSNADNW